MSLDSSNDPDIAAAFSADPIVTAAPTASSDPDINAAFSDTAPGAEGKRVSWAEENLAGPGEILGSGFANIPHAFAHGGLDIYRRLTGGDTEAPEPDMIKRLEVPIGKGGKQLLGDIRAMVPKRDESAQGPDDTSIPQFGETTQNVLGHGLSVAQDVAGLTAGASVLRGLTRATPKLTATGAPAADAQAVVNEGASAQSMGAAGTPADVSAASPELKAAITEAGPTANTEVLNRHLDAEQLPLPEGSTPLRLRRGQATGDAQQISDEKNLRADPDTNGILTDSIADQDKKLGQSIGEIRRRATPDIVQRTNAEHDQAAVDTIKTQDNALTLDKRAKYKALADANGGAIPIDTGAAIKDIDTQLQHGYLTRTAQDNGVISEITGDLRSGRPITFERFENARTRLAEIQRRGGADGAAAGIVHDSLEKMPLPPEAAPLKQLADTARAAARTQFQLKEQNPAYKAATEDNVPKDNKGLHVIGAPSPLAGNFLNRYALGNGPNATGPYIQRLKQAVPDPVLSQSIEAATLNDLRDAAGIDKFGNGSFKNNPYRNESNRISDKAGALLSPESIENTERLKRISGYVTDETPAGSTNRSNTALTLQRFGAKAEAAPTVAGELGNAAGDAAAHSVAGPAGVFGKNIVQKILKGSQEAKAAQALKDSKLKFAQDAVKPGAGLDYKP